MGKRIVILGSGESALGAAILAKKQGFSVLVSDNNAIKESAKKELLDNKIDFEEGGHSDRIFDCEEVIKSPGIADTAEVVVNLKKRGKKIISEIEFGMRYCESKVIGITGANGKTTTTLLIHHLLTSAGKKAKLAGNIGNSLAREVAKNDQPEYYVVELSSFQLDGMYDSCLDIAILTNITPDHLDRYDHKMENYIASKFRIVRNQTSENHFIYNADDPVTKANIDNFEINATKIAISKNNVPFDEKILSIKGLHNLYNALEAYVCAKIVGIEDVEILSGLRTFRNAPHRLEFVRKFNGVDYINDSKATNVDSAYYALQAQSRPVVWIAGGKDKGNDYNAIAELVSEKVKALVCLGKDNKKLIDFFSACGKKTNKFVVYDTHSIEECVRKCSEIAEEGDVVLLSPCCASFDLFESYENRGDLFKECVNRL